MPELPEVETVARDLRGLIVGARVSGVRVTWLRTLRSQDPAAFEAAIVGRTIVGTSRRAKLVVLDLDDGGAITIHLKMTGQLFVVPAAQPEDRYVRLVLVLEDGRELRFRDIRKFGRVGLARRDVAGAEGDLRGELGGSRTFKGFGPEPLDPSFTVRAFGKRLRSRRGRLKPLLMDQSFLAGVGNIYADEALWAARLHPLRSAVTLRRGDPGRLFRHLRAILAEAVERRGSSVDDYTAPEGDGSMQERLLVYQRAGEPCPRCGRPIRRVVVGGRATHFCSWCQRLPAADRQGAAAILGGMVPRPGRAPGRPGGRWTDLARDQVGEVGRGPDGSPAARAERVRRAAATRRAAARAGAVARASASVARASAPVGRAAAAGVETGTGVGEGPRGGG
ncbi:MAG TPA: bifunctional DNA-formamidopyrimidine glycosylase/DNA-(apurinic or apyrimidinic site) lyase [Candidatus Limnocylindrales bacterium]|nr:bifunctional DNA-formamidopyrimidine glycosylase/DNA-(apurinic or apyrimidinic site) lyase [Candidatus Limnocylindrales bacterium]